MTEAQRGAAATRARWRRASATFPQFSIEHQRRRPLRDRSKNRALQVSEALEGDEGLDAAAPPFSAEVRQVFNDTDADSLRLVVGTPAEIGNALEMTPEMIAELYPDGPQALPPELTGSAAASRSANRV